MKNSKTEIWYDPKGGCGWPMCAYYDKQAIPMSCARARDLRYVARLCTYERQADTRNMEEGDRENVQ